MDSDSVSEAYVSSGMDECVDEESDSYAVSLSATGSKEEACSEEEDIKI